MPAVSKKQQNFMRLVKAYKAGKVKDVSKEVKDAAKSMSEEQVDDFTKKTAGIQDLVKNIPGIKPKYPDVISAKEFEKSNEWPTTLIDKMRAMLGTLYGKRGAVKPVKPAKPAINTTLK